MNEHVKVLRRERPATQAAEGVPRWRWTTTELQLLVEAGLLGSDERVELIGGEIVPMPPRGRRHELVREELENALRGCLPAGVRLVAEPQLNLDEATYTNPELLLRPTAIVTPDIRGPTALLVVEVADTSWERDTTLKARLYASSGVREYWAVNASTLSTRVHRMPEAHAYASVIDVPPHEVLVPALVPQVSVRLADLDI